MTQRRPLYAVESTPPTTPPTYDYLQRLKDATDPTDGTEDTPLGITMGPAFPATPQAYHRHLLTDGTIASTVEPFYWDATRASGAGRWVSERTFDFTFTAAGAITNNPLNLPSVGASGVNLGYWGGGRPMVLIWSAALQTASGGDAGLQLQLRSSVSGLTVAQITLGTNLVLQQSRRDILIPTLGTAELFYCHASGTTGAGVVVTWRFKRTE